MIKQLAKKYLVYTWSSDYLYYFYLFYYYQTLQYIFGYNEINTMENYNNDYVMKVY